MHRPSTHRWCRLEVLSLLFASLMGVASVAHAQNSGPLAPPPNDAPRKSPPRRAPQTPPPAPSEPAPASEPAPSSAPAPAAPPAAPEPALAPEPPVSTPVPSPSAQGTAAPAPAAPPQRSDADQSLIPGFENDVSIRVGKLKAEYESAMDSATKLMARGDYNDAKIKAEAARLALQRDGRLLPPAEFEDMNSRVMKLQDQIGQNSFSAAEQAKSDQQKKAEQEAAANRAKDQQKRQEQIRQKLLLVRELQMQQKYKEAMDVVDEILFMDPNNPAALTLRDVIDSALLYRQYSDVQRRRNFGYGDLRLEDAEANVPPRRNKSKEGPRSLSGSLVYPEDWEDLTSDRKKYGATGWVRTPADQEIERLLSDNLNCSTYESSVKNGSAGAMTLDRLINWWAEMAKVPVFVNWSALKSANVTKETTVAEIQVPKGRNGQTAFTAKDFLERIFQSLMDGDEPRELGDKMPRFEVIDGYLLVTSAEDLQKRKEAMTPRVYDIRDLVFKEKNFVSTGIPSSGGQGGGGGGSGGGGSGGGGGGGGGGGFGGGGGGGSGGGGSGGGGQGTVQEDTARDDAIRKRVDEIKDLIKKVVDPAAWDADTAKMEDFDQKLIITALPETHRNLIDLLTQIRAVQALEIGIEVRVLQINSEWFEQIGIDLDMYFNTNSGLYDAARSADPNMGLRDFFFQGTQVRNGANTLKNPVVFGGIGGTDTLADSSWPNQIATGSAIGTSTNPISNTVTYQQGSVGPPLGVIKRGDQYANGETSTGFGPVQMQQEGLRLTDTLAAGGISSVMGLAALANPAMTVGMTFLDDVQVDLLVQATQADQRNSILTAPRLTLLNGQQSAISIGRTIYYVSGFTPGTGNATGVPITTPFNGGISMTLQAVASADRRYVTMTVLFQDNNLEGFDTQDIQQSVAGGGTGGGGSATSRNQIQLPRYRTSQINTSVSVPDKGTVMLGGQKYTTDYEVEVGVPVLSKIPVVNRFFTNRVNSKVENNLLLLIRPEIMIQAESEDKLFPGLLGSRDQVAGDSQVR